MDRSGLHADSQRAFGALIGAPFESDFPSRFAVAIFSILFERTWSGPVLQVDPNEVVGNLSRFRLLHV